MVASVDDWAKGRVMWEADPQLTYSDIAKVVGVSKQAVAGRAKRDGWKKVANQSEVTRRAYEAADIQTAREDSGLTLADRSPLDASSAAMTAAVDVRARVLGRHRKEWDGVRNQLYQALKLQDFDKAKLAKITSEAMRIIQDGERKAHGLDQEDKSGPNEGKTVIVIERRDGV